MIREPVAAEGPCDSGVLSYICINTIEISLSPVELAKSSLLARTKITSELGGTVLYNFMFQDASIDLKQSCASEQESHRANSFRPADPSLLSAFGSSRGINSISAQTAGDDLSLDRDTHHMMQVTCTRQGSAYDAHGSIHHRLHNQVYLPLACRTYMLYSYLYCPTTLVPVTKHNMSSIPRWLTSPAHLYRTQYTKTCGRCWLTTLIISA